MSVTEEVRRRQRPQRILSHEGRDLLLVNRGREVEDSILDFDYEFEGSSAEVCCVGVEEDFTSIVFIRGYR